MTAIKLAMLALLALVLFGVRSGLRPEAEEKRQKPDLTPFAKTVRPILAARCAPCHEPGGKMYERLPFDRSETIVSHREGVLKRLKGDDREAVERWLASLPPDSK